MKITVDDTYYTEINEQIRNAADTEIILDKVYGQRYIGCGIKGKTITINGTPGNALGSYMDGADVIVHGNAQDATGDTMNDGSIIIHGNCGDTTGYGMRGGKILIKGNAGYRVGIHMKEYKEQKPVVVVGGKTGDFLGEYQAGGIIIVLGIGVDGIPVGNFCGTGMHGGAIYLRCNDIPEGLPPQVSATSATEEDKKQIDGIVVDFCENFGYDKKEILKSNFIKLTANTKNPYKQLYTHN
ncbi:glutamate synthase [Ruminiclostridium papyrosolvens]|uniref:Glutamate synthase n=1 Tax=Ruminiclostridium papyrosolvens C7 TaxID=1330534 RepID=U4R0R6_9FIRM|nr:glutamate synthase [Ruminiclostridium papyrosolvens]EPR11704.1 glutamate synthase [Ruminiclostridium papyrosolvens C7]